MLDDKINIKSETEGTRGGYFEENFGGSEKGD